MDTSGFLLHLVYSKVFQAVLNVSLVGVKVYAVKYIYRMFSMKCVRAAIGSMSKHCLSKLLLCWYCCFTFHEQNFSALL